MKQLDFTIIILMPFQRKHNLATMRKVLNDSTFQRFRDPRPCHKVKGAVSLCSDWPHEFQDQKYQQPDSSDLRESFDQNNSWRRYWNKKFTLTVQQKVWVVKLSGFWGVHSSEFSDPLSRNYLNCLQWGQLKQEGGIRKQRQVIKKNVSIRWRKYKIK